MKHINSPEDLAINGARPAFDHPLYVGRPNVGSKDAFLAHVDEMFERHWFTNNGPLVCEFEQKLAASLGVRHCVVMCNGTVALEVAIRALELKGEVIVPSFTFVATAHALQWQEITPVFADVNPRTHNLDPAAVVRMITPRTTGIIGVHVWGRPCPVDELQQIAAENGLRLLFDAAHAFGCRYKGRVIGNFGECEVFSFHATKFFNTFEGGAVATNNDALAEKLRLMRNFGFSGYDNVIYHGTNGKMTEVCAAMGLAGLSSIGEIIKHNWNNYQHYGKCLRAVRGVQLIDYAEENSPNYQYVVLEIAPDFPMSRDRIVEILHAENVIARKYFWPGCHKMYPYSQYYPHAKLLLGNTEAVSERIVVLPTGTSVGPDEIETVCRVFSVLSGR